MDHPRRGRTQATNATRPRPKLVVCLAVWSGLLAAALAGCGSEGSPGASGGGGSTGNPASTTLGPTSATTHSALGGATSTAATSVGGATAAAAATTAAGGAAAASNGAGGSGLGSAGMGGSISVGQGGASSVAVGGAGGTTAVVGAGGSGGIGGSGGLGSKHLVFLLIGQSNMEGAPQPQAEDREEDERISVLAYDNCQNLGRSYDEWYTASPPLHSCEGGVGPGDYFAKTLIEGLPEGYTIGLVPLGVNGAPIDVFRKNVPRPGWYLPPDDHWETGFEWIVSRAELAQQQGVIAGILFHQGESDDGQPEWVDEVAGLVSDLRTDLGLGSAPFLAGEVYRDGAAAGHNTLINELPDAIDNAHVISSEGLTGTDTYHFDLQSQRELGRRYGLQMLELLDSALGAQP